jgi:hypothetical protein
MRIKIFSFIASLCAGVSLLIVALPMESAIAQKPAPKAPPAQAAAPPALKQIALTDKLVEDSLATNAEILPVVAKLPETAKPNPKVVAQLDDIAKKHGFANYGEYDEVSGNINLVLSGFDPETKQYVGQDAVLKKEIDAINADSKMPAKDKKAALAALNTELKSITPLQFQDNIKVVAKYLDQLSAAMPQDKQ